LFISQKLGPKHTFTVLQERQKKQRWVFYLATAGGHGIVCAILPRSPETLS